MKGKNKRRPYFFRFRHFHPRDSRPVDNKIPLGDLPDAEGCGKARKARTEGKERWTFPKIFKRIQRQKGTGVAPSSVS